MAARKGRRHRRKKRQKKNTGLILGIVGGTTGVLLAGYIGAGVYFSSHFLPNTEINGHDCSGKPVSEVEEIFKKEMEGYVLTVTDKDGQKEEITSEDIALEYKESKALKEALKKQNGFAWPVSFFTKDSENATIELSYDEAKLDGKLQGLKAATAKQVKPKSAKPEFDGSQFVVKPEETGTAIDMDVLKKKASEAVTELKSGLNLKSEKCYKEPKYTSKSPEVAEACEKMNQYCQANITYSMDEPVVIDGTVISGWLSVDKNMKVKFKKSKVKEWLEQFGDKYDTMGAQRTFTTPDGRSATVEGGDYGWSIDEDTEYKAIVDAVKNGETITKEPAYYAGGTAAVHGSPDWGDTYAEVDLTTQHMWYVVNGKVALECDVVTGEPVPEKITPTGVYVFKEKEHDSVLVGDIIPSTGKPEYRTKVRNWMRITWSGIGFHDADWQTAFGGERYKNGNGSHGCINMPVDKSGELFDMIEPGIPVIIHN